jgi:hypothetical protein
MQEFSIGAGRGQAQGFPPGALGGRASAEPEMELADHRVPTGITGGNAFRKNGGQACPMTSTNRWKSYTSKFAHLTGFMSHTLIVWSLPAEANNLPS